MDGRNLILLVAALLLFLVIVGFIVAYVFQPIPVQEGTGRSLGENAAVSRSSPPAVKGWRPDKNIQQLSDLTSASSVRTGWTTY
jgi:hypothetical protein